MRCPSAPDHFREKKGGVPSGGSPDRCVGMLALLTAEQRLPQNGC